MKIAVWYHIKPSGQGIDTGFAQRLFGEQMSLLETSGLLAASSHTVIGVNGSSRLNVPRRTTCLVHGPNSRSELPTLHALQQWLTGHEDWYVCYHHAKGITHYPPDGLHRSWLRCMERAVIIGWRNCVADLDRGCDMAGAHWLTREQYGPCVNTFFWGGNFWWAKAGFLAKLPKIRENSTCRDQDFEAETWIGTGPRPQVRDYGNHWPDRCPRNHHCYLIR